MTNVNKYNITEIMTHLDGGLTVKEMSVKMGVSYSGLRSFMYDRGIKVNRKSKNMEKVLQLSKTLSARDISNKTGLSICYVRTVRYRLGVDKRESEYRIEKVLQLWRSGNTIENIQVKTKLHRETILRYLREARTSRGNGNL